MKSPTVEYGCDDNHTQPVSYQINRLFDPAHTVSAVPDIRWTAKASSAVSKGYPKVEWSLRILTQDSSTLHGQALLIAR